jgi:hypothetical protein
MNVIENDFFSGKLFSELELSEPTKMSLEKLGYS